MTRELRGINFFYENNNSITIKKCKPYSRDSSHFRICNQAEIYNHKVPVLTIPKKTHIGDRTKTNFLSSTADYIIHFYHTFPPIDCFVSDRNGTTRPGQLAVGQLTREQFNAG